MPEPPAQAHDRRVAIPRLLQPRRIAVIGASADPGKTTGRPIHYLRKHGFTGAIYPVNPRVSQIDGLPCYPSAAALPEAPDVALVLLGADRVEPAIRELAARGTASAIVLAGGYAEAGEAGQLRQAALKAAAGAMRLLGPNTIGLVNLVDRITLSASGALEISDLPVGRISVVSQSGGILGSLLSRAADRGIGLARLVSTGNEADIDSTDLVEHLLDDAETSVVALYLEGMRRPDAFRAAAARAAALGKPLVVFKVGRSAPGAHSAISHTGAMAGSDRVHDAMFRQYGVIRAESFTDLLDIPAGLVAGRRARGRRVAILTSTGGAGTLVADSCGLAGFEFPDPATAARLADLLGAPATGNPIDVTLAGLRPDLLRSALSCLLDSPGYDAVIAIAGSSAIAAPGLVADAAAACLSEGDKPLLAYVSPHAPHAVRRLNAAGIPAFATPESLAAVLQALQPRATPPPATLGPRLRAPDLPPAGTRNEAESKALFAHFGIPVTRGEIAADPATAEALAHRLGGRVVLKILSRKIAHKSEVGGVKTGLAPADIPQACAAMLASLRRAGAPSPEGFLVQEQIDGGVEMLLGLHRDPQFGPLLLLGMGGEAAEVLRDTAIRLLPIGPQDARAMIGELKTARLLDGLRGRPAADVEALVAAVMAFAAMATALGERLAEAEINPLFVLPEGQGVRAADGLVVLRDH